LNFDKIFKTVFIFNPKIKNRLLNIVLLFLYAISNCYAEIVLDGSLGRQDVLQGPHFLISADLGKSVGRNLFHSFSQFNLDKGESATFSSFQPIDNIINRITSGQTSFIDGHINSHIPAANLFFINPEGFVFGKNARLNVQGSFYASTANELKLGKTGTFNAQYPKKSILTSAPPIAFGFLDTPSSSISIQGSKLKTPVNKILSFSSGEIDIESARLTANSGEINLIGIKSTDHLSIHSPDVVQGKLGQITMQNNASLDVGRKGGGNIFIRSGLFEIHKSDIIANTRADKDGGVIDINANKVYLNDAKIDSRSLGEAQGGDILIDASSEVSLVESNIFTTALSKKSVAGDAGNIHLTAKHLDLFNSTISTATFGKGQGGDIYIVVEEDIELDSAPKLLIPYTGIRADSSYLKKQGGNAGNIFVQAKNLYLIGTNTLIDNSTDGTGNGGNITLNISDTLLLAETSTISADSNGMGDAGTISLDINYLDMNGGIISTDANDADGGNIVINVHELLTLRNNSQITATVSGGRGDGGNVVLANPRFFQLYDSKVIANANRGRGGTILIVTHDSLNQKNSLISASSEHGSDGEVEIGMPNVDISTLSANFLDATTLIKKRCIARHFNTQRSSFIIIGRNGLPNAPDDLQTYIPLTWGKSNSDIE